MAASIGSSKKLDRASAAFSSQSRSANIQNIKKSLLQATDEELYKCAVALQTGFFKSEQKEDTGRFHHGVVRFKDVPKRDIGILLLDVLRPPTVAKLDEAADDALRSAFCVIYGVDLSWKVPSKVVATFMEKLRERRLNLGNRACSNDFWHFKDISCLALMRSSLSAMLVALLVWYHQRSNEASGPVCGGVPARGRDGRLLPPTAGGRAAADWRQACLRMQAAEHRSTSLVRALILSHRVVKRVYPCYHMRVLPPLPRHT